MNANLVSLVSCCTGVATGIGGSKIYTKITGKTAGVPGSIAHITTNDNLTNEAKLHVFGQYAKEGLKDTIKLAGVTTAAAAGGSLAVANSTKCAKAFGKLTSTVSEFLGKTTINGTNVKEAIKDTQVFKKLNALPTAAKAGIAAGAAVLAMVLPIVSVNSAAKSGYIEGQHEGL